MSRPLIGGPAVHTLLSALDANQYVPQLTAHATPGSDGAWTELEASTTHAIESLKLMLFGGAVAGDGLIDIAVGAGGSEKIIVSGLPVNVIGTGLITGHYAIPELPVPVIPTGTRIAARLYRSTAASFTARIGMIGSAPSRGSQAPVGQIHTLGTVAANAAGTVVDPGATSNTEGAQTDITTSSPRLRRLLVIAVHSGSSTWTTFNRAAVLRLYQGGAGSEKLIVPPMPTLKLNGIDNSVPIVSGWYDVDIPSGTTIRATLTNETNTSTYRSMAVTLLGY